MPAPVSYAPRTLQFYSLLVLFTYFGLARGGLGLSITVSDLLLHFAGYTVLMISGMLTYGQRQTLLFTGLLVYSVAIEIIQFFLPYRTFELLDILANLAGLSTGAVVWRLYQRYSLQNPIAADRGDRTDEQG